MSGRRIVTGGLLVLCCATLAAAAYVPGSSFDYRRLPYPLEQIDLGVPVVAVTANGDHCYLLDGDDTFRVLDLAIDGTPVPRGEVALGASGTDLAVLSDGRVACACGTAGVVVVDPSDPADPVLDDVLPLDEAVVAVGNLMDGVVALTPDSLYTLAGSPLAVVGRLGLPSSCSLLAVDSELARAYVVGNLDFLVVDLAGTAPVLAGQRDIWTSALDLDLVTPTIVAVVDGEGNCDAWDVSDPTNPRIVASEYPDQLSQRVAVAGAVAYVAGNEGIRQVDFSDPLALSLGSFVPLPNSSPVLAAAGSYGLLGDGDLLRTLHLPARCEAPDTVQAAETGHSYDDVLWGGETVFALDAAGFLVASDPFHGVRDTLTLASRGRLLVGAPPVIFVLEVTGRLLAVDVSDPDDMQRLGSIGLGATPKDAVLVDDLLYVGLAMDGRGAGLVVVGVGYPENLEILDTDPAAGSAQAVGVSGDVCVVGTLLGDLRVYDLTQYPIAPPVAIHTLSGRPQAVGWGQNTALVVLDDGLESVQLEQPDAPETVGRWVVPDQYSDDVRDGAFLERNAYLAAGNDGVWVLDVGDPKHPRLRGIAWAGDDAVQRVAAGVAPGQEAICLAIHSVGAVLAPYQQDDPTTAVMPSARPSRLAANHPNPFNPATELRFDLPRRMQVDLGVYDLRGRRLATLASGMLTAGTHVVTWRGRTDDGVPVASGVYLVRLSTAAGEIRSRKITLAR